MGGYDYGNARLRAMKSRLLSRADLSTLAQTTSPEHLLAALTRTTYRKAIEATLVRASEMEVINRALSLSLVTTIQKARRFLGKPTPTAVSVALGGYDIHNIKVILRGLAKNVSPAELFAILLPIGDLSETILVALTQAESPQIAIDQMASMRLPQARPLVAARAQAADFDLPALELALECWYFDHSLAIASDVSPEDALLQHALALEADLTNLLTVLRIVQAAPDRAGYLPGTGPGELAQQWVGPGSLPITMLEQACTRSSLEEGIRTLSTTRYGPVLATGLAAYQKTHRLSDIERHIRHYRLLWYAGLIARDPLGIGVFLGYLALLVNEISNLRWITRGINIGLTPEVMLSEMEFVS